MAYVSRSSLAAAGAIGIIILSAVVTFAAGILIFCLLPLLLVAVVGALEAGFPPADLGSLAFVAWLIWAYVLVVRIAIVGLGVMSDATARNALRLVLLMALLFVTSPVFWMWLL